MGDRATNLEAAIGHLGALGTVTARSSLYETEPVEVVEQPWFLNCAVAMETELMPKQFLARAMALEPSILISCCLARPWWIRRRSRFRIGRCMSAALF